MIAHELVPAPDPVECCERMAGLPYVIFLDSAVRGTPLGRYSFLMADPADVVRGKGRDSRGALDDVRALMAPRQSAPIPGLPPFQTGAAGYIAYDWGRTIERLPPSRYDDLDLPDIVFGIYDWVIAWDHEADRAWIVARNEELLQRAKSYVGRPFQGRQKDLGDTERVAPRTAPPSYPVDAQWADPRIGLRSSFTHAAYLDAVNRVREYIFAGDIFQANLSQRFEAPLSEPPWDLYRRLRERNPAPFAAYLDFPGAVVLSASPERFLHVDAGGHVETRPIKGTRPRGVGPEHDAALGLALVESLKDIAREDVLAHAIDGVEIRGVRE